MLALLAASLLVLSGISALHLLELNIPQTVDIRSNVTLSCTFRMTKAKLYSVKWYKDDFEFFRFMPDNIPEVQSFPVPGVTLDVESSNMNNVTLVQLSFNSTGSYRCEVSSEGPIFETTFKTRNMTVTALPLTDPTLEGLRPSYEPGDLVKVNCTSAASKPAAILFWTINGSPTSKQLQSDQQLSVDERGLMVRRLELSFPAEPAFFQDGGRTHVRCTAMVAGSRREQNATASLSGLGSQRLQQSPGSRALATSPPPAPVLLVLLLLVASS